MDVNLCEYNYFEGWLVLQLVKISLSLSLAV